ncbi:WEB family protein At5g55860-like [Olea europaea var. sylvestris]|uniref:WEB family At5g55860 n=1 Tax=Olea europaea subsp. europaea TaxID=158383 RepID=A0A8S0QZY2_OLEEU|nr:WEB family protein At5g55860-like [Olea europaea var. sylvestris]XP_022879162.1 WEB family protein At5g55860-like [Olea europaea var. sylvestris]XP_022879163.1 WEB family protein At5g55860-like [Olea europaea var. sylvestris]XP_022879164.1 WEB family protein At5g55860-like [Olea europaea var. sylvestris]CAA2972193.1 WEB family At5g55860 [Olea europaea subsp. europaea]
MAANDHQTTKGSAKAEVGEIDTSAPFQSVKDAVSLFGEGAFSGEKPAIKKPKPHSAERVLAKETQLHLAQKELNKLKEQLKNAETMKAQALEELERAKQTVEDLTQKLKTHNESKYIAVRATEAAKHRAKQFEETRNSKSEGNDGSAEVDLETARVQYTAAVTELDAVKQELRKIREEYNASTEAKNLAIEQAAKAENSAKANMERRGELAKEIATLQESIQQVKLASTQAREEEARIYAEKHKQKQSYKAKLEESTKKLLALKKVLDSEVNKNLETQLAETMSEVEAIQKEMGKARASDLDSVRAITSELDDAKESLEKVAEEENSLRSLVDTLKIELENIKKDHLELHEKEIGTESTAGNLHVKLRKAKSELEAALADEAKLSGVSDEMISTIYQLSLESENAKHEVEEMKHNAEELKKEAEAARIELKEAETKLKVALIEAEELKAAEARTLNQIRILSEKTDAARASTSESGAQITISRVEFESLSRKVEEYQKLAELKVAAAIAQVEAVRASEEEAIKKFEASQNEIEDMKTATQEALKKAEMAEAAKKAVEGELRRWREREQKKAVEAASRILAETEKSYESSPQNYQMQKQKSAEKVMETRKLEKARTSVTKKVLMPNLSGVFHKKKNKIEGGTPSYLPGEKPVW